MMRKIKPAEKFKYFRYSYSFKKQVLEEIENGFFPVIQEKMESMWASKLGLNTFEVELFKELLILMMQTRVDYTIFFRELSSLPIDITPLKKSFYNESFSDEKILNRWSQWLVKWKSHIHDSLESHEKLSDKMKLVNPKYTLREWFLVPAYEQATNGDYALIGELQEVMTNPYAELSQEMEEKYYRKKPSHFFEVAGISHVSCSS